MSFKNNNKSFIPLAKLLAIIGYDSLIIVTILLLATTLLFFICLVLNFNTPSPHSIYFRLYLASIIVTYYHISWAYTLEHQTIGMRAWKVKLVDNNNQPISLKQSIYRIIFGNLGFWCFGLGYIYLYFNKHRNTLADITSGTKLYNL